MTRADIELMLTNLAETTLYLQESSLRMREAAKHMGTVADTLTRLDAVGTTGGKATVATAVPTPLRLWLKASRRSQTSLAKEAGVSTAYMSMLLAGRRTPSLPVAKRLHAATGLAATEFIAQVEEGEREAAASLPMILTLTDVAAIYRLSVSTIRRGLQNGTFAPRPWKRYPYRWRREDILADLKRPHDERPHKPHGFATTRRRKKS